MIVLDVMWQTGTGYGDGELHVLLVVEAIALVFVRQLASVIDFPEWVTATRAPWVNGHQVGKSQPLFLTPSIYNSLGSTGQI